jgi:hypothetical protein
MEVKGGRGEGEKVGEETWKEEADEDETVLLEKEQE